MSSRHARSDRSYGDFSTKARRASRSTPAPDVVPNARRTQPTLGGVLTTHGDRGRWKRLVLIACVGLLLDAALWFATYHERKAVSWLGVPLDLPAPAADGLYQLSGRLP